MVLHYFSLSFITLALCGPEVLPEREPHNPMGGEGTGPKSKGSGGPFRHVSLVTNP